tara:strand:- start:10 stop:2949 length:2940 start_codon:yes stop_codon:yes gene_type:complete
MTDTLLIQALKKQGTNQLPNGWTTKIDGGIEVKRGDKVSVEGISINARGVADSTLEITKDLVAGKYAPNKFAFRFSYYINNNLRYTCPIPQMNSEPNLGTTTLDEKTNYGLGDLASDKIFANQEQNGAGVPGVAAYPYGYIEGYGLRPSGDGACFESEDIFIASDRCNGETMWIVDNTVNGLGHGPSGFPPNDQTNTPTYNLYTKDVPIEISIGFDSPVSIATKINDQLHHAREGSGGNLVRVGTDPQNVNFNDPTYDQPTLILNDGISQIINTTYNNNSAPTPGDPSTPYAKMVVDNPEYFKHLAEVQQETSKVLWGVDDANNPVSPGFPISRNELIMMADLPVYNPSANGFGANRIIPVNYDIPNPAWSAPGPDMALKMGNLFKSLQIYEGDTLKKTPEECFEDYDNWYTPLLIGKYWDVPKPAMPPMSDLPGVPGGTPATLCTTVATDYYIAQNKTYANYLPPARTYVSALTYYNEEILGSLTNENIMPGATTWVNNDGVNPATPFFTSLVLNKVGEIPAWDAFIKSNNLPFVLLEYNTNAGNSGQMLGIVLKDNTYYKSKWKREKDTSVTSIPRALNFIGDQSDGFHSQKASIVSPFAAPDGVASRGTGGVSWSATDSGMEESLICGAYDPAFQWDAASSRFTISQFHNPVRRGDFTWTDGGDAFGPGNTFYNLEIATDGSTGGGDAAILAIANPYIPYYKAWGATAGGTGSQPPNIGFTNMPICHTQCGVAIEDICLFNISTQTYEPITKDEYEGCCLERMGFAFDDLVVDKRFLLNGMNFRNNIARPRGLGKFDRTPTTATETKAELFRMAIPVRTNLEMDSALNTAMEINCLDGHSYGMGTNKGSSNIMAQTSMIITATNMPKKLANPYWLIKSDIIDGITYIGGDGQPNNIVAVVGREYLEGDYSFAFGNNYSFVATQDMTLSQIKTQILTPEFKELNIDENSIVIYKIERQNEALQLVAQLQEMAAQKKK